MKTYGFRCKCGVICTINEDDFPLHCRCGRTYYSHVEFHGGPVERPGTELSKLLKRFGFGPVKGCKCKARAAIMDRRGCQWCRDHLDAIAGWMREEAERRKLPFVDFAARQIISLAIRRAERIAAERV